MKDGVIKYNQVFNQATPLPDAALDDLKYCRAQLYTRGWIGIDDDGIGFGNLSKRLHPYGNEEFIISASQTGHLKNLNNEHFTLVKSFNILENKLSAKGTFSASSEALSHAAFYSLSKKINFVFHIHAHVLWNKYLNILPTTFPNVPYGTPAMAEEIFRLFTSSNLANEKVVITAGHQDGIFCFSETYQDGLKCLFSL